MTKVTETIQVPVPEATELDMKIPGEEPFDSLVSKRQKLKAEIERMTAERASLDLIIGSILDLNQLQKVACQTGGEQWVVSRREASTPRKSIDATKLLNLGVPAQIIKEATVYGQPGKAGIMIRRASERGEGENGEPN